ncbi:hypothetical protein MNV84_08440 [Leishmania braziliensis]|nr:hypothetical protein MNV84_08440 [Leishmania braziliensis]
MQDIFLPSLSSCWRPKHFRATPHVLHLYRLTWCFCVYVCVCLFRFRVRPSPIPILPFGAFSMENRGKSEWRLLVVLAVGAIAYYLFTLKLAPNPEERRLAALRRIRDGASPLTLLEEGFSSVELLHAGVPREALNSASAVSLSTSPSQTPRRESCSRSPSTPSSCSRVCDPLMMVVTDTMHVVKEALRGGRRCRSMSTSISNVREATRSKTTGSTTALSSRSSQLHAKSPSNSSLRSSTRLTAHVQSPPLRQEFYDCLSPMRSSATRTPAGALRVRVAALSAVITRDYASESATYNYPLEVLRFLHEDSSRLSIMAENCSALEGDEVLTTEVYVKRSLERARAAAENAKAYFKVSLSTAARNIATTVMESYVNIYTGPSPVILAALYLVKGNIAYTIQLQTHIGTYEERLPDLLYTAQSARLLCAEKTPCGWWRRRPGRNEYHVQAQNVDRTYVVETPVDVAVRAPRTPHALRSELILMPCSSGGDTGAQWCAIVAVVPSAAREHARKGEKQHKVIPLLHDAHVSIELTVHMPDSAAAGTTSSPPPLPPPLAAVMAREATARDAQLFSSVYRSAELTMPLPPPEYFQTVVCEHPYETSVTLFITSLTSAESFEVELRCLKDMNDVSLKQLLSYVPTLLLNHARPRCSTNAAGQACFSVEGLAVSPTETTLRVYGVQQGAETWLIMRWLCASTAVELSELEQYRSELLKRVLC